MTPGSLILYPGDRGSGKFLTTNRKTLSILFILFATLLTACGCTGTPVSQQAAENKSDYVIAYNVLVDEERDDYEVFVMNLDGSDPTNVIHRSGVEWSYLAVGEKLYFVSDRDTCRRCYRLWVTDSAGDDPRLVSNLRLADSWMSARAGGGELIVKPHEGSGFVILDEQGSIIQSVETGLPFSTDPLFVDDGRRIVFRGGMTASKRVEGFKEELFVIDVAAGGRRQLTHYPEGDPSGGGYSYRAGPPRQHPLDRFITYQSRQDGKYSLFAVTLDGSRQWKLIDTPFNEGWHDWSPDGRWLAVELFDDTESQFHIGLMNWETRELTVLTGDEYKYQQAPVFVVRTSR